MGGGDHPDQETSGGLQDSFPTIPVPLRFHGAKNWPLEGNWALVHLPGGVPKKGVNKANKDLFSEFSLFFSENVRVQTLRLNACF